VSDELRPLSAILPSGPKVRPKTLEKGVKAEEGYAYHATHAGALHDIADYGRLSTHKPSHGTDQKSWPDGATERRAYFSHSPDIARNFVGEGRAVLLRTKRGEHIKTEKGTGDLYSPHAIRTKHLQYHGEDDNWHPVSGLKKERPPKE
jgi:hypothetical protein